MHPELAVLGPIQWQLSQVSLSALLVQVLICPREEVTVPGRSPFPCWLGRWAPRRRDEAWLDVTIPARRHMTSPPVPARVYTILTTSVPVPSELDRKQQIKTAVTVESPWKEEEAYVLVLGMTLSPAFRKLLTCSCASGHEGEGTRCSRF